MFLTITSRPPSSSLPLSLRYYRTNSRRVRCTFASNSTPLMRLHHARMQFAIAPSDTSVAAQWDLIEIAPVCVSDSITASRLVSSSRRDDSILLAPILKSGGSSRGCSETQQPQPRRCLRRRSKESRDTGGTCLPAKMRARADNAQRVLPLLCQSFTCCGKDVSSTDVPLNSPAGEILRVHSCKCSSRVRAAGKEYPYVPVH